MQIRYRDTTHPDIELHDWYYLKIPGTQVDAEIRRHELENDGWEVELVGEIDPNDVEWFTGKHKRF